MSVKAIYSIAKQEFIRVLTHPIVPSVVLIVIFMAILIGAGDVSDLNAISVMNSISNRIGQDVLIVGLGQCWWTMSMLCTIAAVFLGATVIPYERWSNSINVLLTKPLYKRDYYIGKFTGILAFMLLLNTFTILFVGLMMILFFRGPESDTEYVWRVIANIVVSTLSCSLVIALNMFFGTLSKNILFVTTISITYIFFDWIWYSNRILGWLSNYTPSSLNSMLVGPLPPSALTGGQPALFNTLVPFDKWFMGAAPFLIILFIELLFLIFAGIYLFSRDDNV